MKNWSLLSCVGFLTVIAVTYTTTAAGLLTETATDQEVAQQRLLGQG